MDWNKVKVAIWDSVKYVVGLGGLLAVLVWTVLRNLSHTLATSHSAGEATREADAATSEAERVATEATEATADVEEEHRDVVANKAERDERARNYFPGLR